jgi:hypothetical protein
VPSIAGLEADVIEPLEVSMVSDDRYFVLAWAPCAVRTCTELLETSDGGRTFRREVVPPLLQQGPGGQLFEFFTPSVGFSYEAPPNTADRPEPLYVTNDGGASWHPVDLGGSVLAYTAAAGEGFAVTATCAPTCTDYRLARSQLGTGSWKVSTLPAPVGPPTSDVGVTAFGSTLWIAYHTARSAVLLRSDDAGATFSSGPSPCTAGFSVTLEAVSRSVIWALCGTGRGAELFRSADGGASFVQRSVSSDGELTSDAVLGASSAEVAVASEGYGGADQHWFRTLDGGASFSPVFLPPSPIACESIQFADPEHGLALEEEGSAGPSVDHLQLWGTNNGGATWSAVSLP